MFAFNKRVDDEEDDDADNEDHDDDMVLAFNLPVALGRAVTD